MLPEINEIEKKHASVLLNELVDAIKVFDNKKNIIVDCTLWMWWHASKIIERLNAWDIFIWFDADAKNLELAKIRLENISKKNKVEVFFINSNFKNLKKELEKIWIEKITGIYYDLWLSSLHLDEAERWFSFMQNWPLDMRLDKSKGKTAEDIVNSYTASELREIFLKYWEEPQANKISKKIIEQRKKSRLKTTSDLSELVWGSPKTKSRIFQAIRIEVNGEIDAIEESLNDAIKLLEKWWIIFVISFHSLEDRATKQIFKRESRDCICEDLICSCNHKKSLKLLNKKPILPTQEEITNNKRSRSAKARFAEKI